MADQDLNTLSIEELLNDELAEIESIPPIEKDEQVEVYLRLIASRIKEVQRLKALRDAEVSRIVETADFKIKRIDDTVSFFKSQLHNYLLGVHNQNPKVRNLDFLNGKIRFRKLPDKVEIDPDFKPDIESNSAYVVSGTYYTVNKKALMDTVKNGIGTIGLPEWAKFVPGEDKFELEVNCDGRIEKL